MLRFSFPGLPSPSPPVLPFGTLPSPLCLLGPSWLQAARGAGSPAAASCPPPHPGSWRCWAAAAGLPLLMGLHDGLGIARSAGELGEGSCAAAALSRSPAGGLGEGSCAGASSWSPGGEANNIGHAASGAVAGTGWADAPASLKNSGKLTAPLDGTASGSAAVPHGAASGSGAAAGVGTGAA